MIRELKSQAAIIGLKSFKWVVGVVPRRVTLFFMDILFFFVYLGLISLRKICRANLKCVYGDTKTETQYQQMTRACIKNISHSMIDLLHFVERPQKLLRTTQFHNENNLKEALSKGRGVIAVSAHLGNIPLLFVSLSQRGYKVNVIIRPMRDEKMSAFMYDLCAKWNINMIQTVPRQKFFKESLRALQRNELLFILLDEEVREEEGVIVDFLNSRVTRAAGPMLFYERAGSVIMPIFISQNEKGIFEIFFEKALDVETDSSIDQSRVKNISKITKIIENFVKRYPSHWYGWLNKRWAFQ